MRKLMKVLLMGLVVTSMAVPAFAAELTNPVEVYSSLSGQTEVEAWQEMRDSGKTFGQLAEENGYGDAFQEAIKKVHEDRVNDLVEEGKITSEEAQEILNDIADCDGTPGEHAGTHGLFYGGGQGMRGQGGMGRQNGGGRGFGQGNGLRDGSGNMGRWNTDNE